MLVGAICFTLSDEHEVRRAERKKMERVLNMFICLSMFLVGSSTTTRHSALDAERILVGSASSAE